MLDQIILISSAAVVIQYLHWYVYSYCHSTFSLSFIITIAVKLCLFSHILMMNFFCNNFPFLLTTIISLFLFCLLLHLCRYSSILFPNHSFLRQMIESSAHGDEYDGVIFSQLVRISVLLLDMEN